MALAVVFALVQVDVTYNALVSAWGQDWDALQKPIQAHRDANRQMWDAYDAVTGAGERVTVDIFPATFVTDGFKLPCGCDDSSCRDCPGFCQDRCIGHDYDSCDDEYEDRSLDSDPYDYDRGGYDY